MRRLVRYVLPAVAAFALLAEGAAVFADEPSARGGNPAPRDNRAIAAQQRAERDRQTVRPTRPAPEPARPSAPAPSVRNEAPRVQAPPVRPSAPSSPAPSVRNEAPRIQAPPARVEQRSSTSSGGAPYGGPSINDLMRNQKAEPRSSQDRSRIESGQQPVRDNRALAEQARQERNRQQQTPQRPVFVSPPATSQPQAEQRPAPGPPQPAREREPTARVAPPRTEPSQTPATYGGQPINPPERSSREDRGRDVERNPRATAPEENRVSGTPALPKEPAVSGRAAPYVPRDNRAIAEQYRNDRDRLMQENRQTGGRMDRPPTGSSGGVPPVARYDGSGDNDVPPVQHYGGRPLPGTNLRQPADIKVRGWDGRYDNDRYADRRGDWDGDRYRDDYRRDDRRYRPGYNYDRWSDLHQKSRSYPHHKRWFWTNYWRSCPTVRYTYRPYYVSVPVYQYWPRSSGSYFYWGYNSCHYDSGLNIVLVSSTNRVERDYYYESPTVTTTRYYEAETEPLPRWRDYTLDKEEARLAAEDIERGWENDRLTDIFNHVDRDIPIRLYESGQFLFWVDDLEFQDRVREMMRDQGTQGFDIDYVIPVRPGEVMVFARHELEVSGRSDNTQYERYTLERLDKRWVISAFETSPYKILE